MVVRTQGRSCWLLKQAQFATRFNSTRENNLQITHPYRWQDSDFTSHRSVCSFNKSAENLQRGAKGTSISSGTNTTLLALINTPIRPGHSRRTVCIFMTASIYLLYIITWKLHGARILPLFYTKIPTLASPCLAIQVYLNTHVKYTEGRNECICT